MLVELKNVTKKYGRKTVLDGVCFSAGENEAVVVAGRNGSGKTVMLKTVLDLIRNFSGERVVTQSIAGLVEMPGLYASMTGEENLASIIGKDWESATKKYAEIFNVLPFITEKVSKYSSGMKQRLALCLIFSLGRKVVVLDEPYNTLDPECMVDLKNAINAYKNDGNCVIVATHYLFDVCDYADRVYFIDKGHIHEVNEEISKADVSDLYIKFLKSTETFKRK